MNDFYTLLEWRRSRTKILKEFVSEFQKLLSVDEWDKFVNRYHFIKKIL